MMQSNNAAVFWRHDTFLGVCEAIGRDFGFNPDWLRMVFAVTLLFSPVIVLSVYVAMGALVFASRWFFPARAVADTALVAEAPAAAPRADNDVVVAELAAAA